MIHIINDVRLDMLLFVSFPWDVIPIHALPNCIGLSQEMYVQLYHMIYVNMNIHPCDNTVAV